MLDASKLKRVSAGALEDCRRALVWSMKLGTKLCVYCGDVLPDFLEKICISKYKVGSDGGGSLLDGAFTLALERPVGASHKARLGMS